MISAKAARGLVEDVRRLRGMLEDAREEALLMEVMLEVAVSKYREKTAATRRKAWVTRRRKAAERAALHPGLVGLVAEKEGADTRPARTAGGV